MCANEFKEGESEPNFHSDTHISIDTFSYSTPTLNNERIGSEEQIDASR